MVSTHPRTLLGKSQLPNLGCLLAINQREKPALLTSRVAKGTGWTASALHTLGIIVSINLGQYFIKSTMAVSLVNWGRLH